MVDRIKVNLSLSDIFMKIILSERNFKGYLSLLNIFSKIILSERNCKENFFSI